MMDRFAVAVCSTRTSAMSRTDLRSIMNVSLSPTWLPLVPERAESRAPSVTPAAVGKFDVTCLFVKEEKKERRKEKTCNIFILVLRWTSRET